MGESQYTSMQRSFYESQASNMVIGNHKEHNSNPDYWSILLYPLSQGDWSNKTILDFGCGVKVLSKKLPCFFAKTIAGFIFCIAKS